MTAPRARSLVVGIGVRSGARADDLTAALEAALDGMQLDPADIGVVAAWSNHRGHQAVTAFADRLEAQLCFIETDDLIAQAVQRPSARVAALTSRVGDGVAENPAPATGLVSVAEAAVLAYGAEVIVPKHAASTCTIVVGRLGAASTGGASRPSSTVLPPIDPARPELDLAALTHHGDAEIGPDMVDFAVNVAVPAPPAWLARAIASKVPTLAAYPLESPVRHRVAAALGLPPEGVLLVNGAAEAFSLVARARSWRRALVVHPQFTEPDAALLAAGHDVSRHLLDARNSFTLHAAAVDEEADLVVIGNPTNPTSRLHPRADVLALSRPGRLLVVDEAFMDVVPDESESLLPHLRLGSREVLVVRSLTKTFGLAGVRAGFVAGDPDFISELRRVQPPWSVNSLALAAVDAAFGADALEHVDATTRRIEADRAHLVDGLTRAGLDVVPGPRAPFVLARHPDAGRLREALRARGFALRRGDTFPGLSERWLRVAVREPALVDALVGAIVDILDQPPPQEHS